MTGLSMLQLFADTTSSLLPVGKAVAIMIFFGGVTVVSLGGLFASNDMLESMSSVIGTKSPTGARIVCAACALIGIAAIVSALLSVTGMV